MIKGLWDKVKIYCLNHDDKIEMKVCENTEKIKSPFFMCPEYENCGCSNRMNIDDYQNIIEKFMSIYENEPFSDYRGYSFTHKGHRHFYKVKITKYTPNEIGIGVYNKTILGGK